MLFHYNELWLCLRFRATVSLCCLITISLCGSPHRLFVMPVLVPSLGNLVTFSLCTKCSECRHWRKILHSSFSFLSFSREKRFDPGWKTSVIHLAAINLFNKFSRVWRHAYCECIMCYRWIYAWEAIMGWGRLCGRSRALCRFENLFLSTFTVVER